MLVYARRTVAASVNVPRRSRHIDDLMTDMIVFIYLNLPLPACITFTKPPYLHLDTYPSSNVWLAVCDRYRFSSDASGYVYTLVGT